MRGARRMQGTLFGLGVAGALAFGGAQALAAPRAPAAQQCDVEVCRRVCKAIFGPFTGGFCNEQGQCECAF